MGDIRHYTFVALTAILLYGTLYSVVKQTYLDTSSPYHDHHPLNDTHYFARKGNFLNTIFIKKSWGWTTALFLFSYITAPVQTRTKDRLYKYLTLTAIWLLFISNMERFTVYTGGECLFTLPNGDHKIVTNDLCYMRTSITQSTHPALFEGLDISSFAPQTGEYRFMPRIRRGHDISGHVFLLTMATLFLVDQLRPSFRVTRWSSIHAWAIAANIALVGIWLFATYTTAVYFHTPFEKFTGYLLGVVSFEVSQFLFEPRSTPVASHK